MDEIVELLSSNPQEALKKLRVNDLDKRKIDDLHAEFNDISRDIRTSQIGYIQKDKTIGTYPNQKIVKKVRIPIAFQNKIVKTATAFEVGEPTSLIPDEKNKLTDEILRLWKVNRLDATLQKSKILQKSELQCAISFYIKTSVSDNKIAKYFGLNKKKSIKTRLFQNKNGTMYPYFDAFGDMKYFTWEFAVKENNKDVNYVWIYDATNIYILGPVGDQKLVLTETTKHGFNNIPIVYLSQERPEWFDVQEMIDRLEVSVSRLGDSNDYTGHPILKIYGDVQGAPTKDDEGKAFTMPMKYNDETGKMEHGEVEFLTYDQAPESVKLEQDRLEKYIYSLTSTPDISFENLKGLGNVSGIAIKLMFLDAIIKAKMNEGENRTIIERINSILISGTVNTVATSLKVYMENTFLNVQFNSIIPDDLSDSVQTLAKAVEGKFMSRKKAIEIVNMADDYDDEMDQIEAENRKEVDIVPDVKKEIEEDVI